MALTLHIESSPILTSDCTILAHQTNCFSVNQTWIAKQIEAVYPQAYEADKKYKLPPRQRLGKFSFALSDDQCRLIFHLYGQFRYGSERNYTDYHALEGALHAFFQAVTLSEKKGYPVKIGMPLDLGTGVAGGEETKVHMLLEELSNNYGYDLYLYPH